MPRRRALTAALTLALLAATAACGSDGGGEPAAVTPAATSPAPAPAETPAMTITTPEQAAAAIGCTGYIQSPDPAPHVDQWGTCKLDGSPVRIYQFADDAAYHAFLDASAAYGVTEAWLVRTGDVAVAPDDQTQIAAIRAALGVTAS